MRYRPQRFPADIEVRVERNDEVQRAQLINVSSTGAKLTGLPPLPPETRVTICHLHLRFPAQVLWSKERLTGVRFVTPLSSGDLNLLRGVDGRRTGVWGLSQGPLREL